MHLFRLRGFFRRTLPKEPDLRLAESTLGLGVVIGRRNLIAGHGPDAARFYPLVKIRDVGFVAETVGKFRWWW